MNAIVADKKEMSDAKRGDLLLVELSDETALVKAAGKRMKEIELELLELAETNPQWFEESKTKDMEHGQLKWSATSKVVTPEGFDLKSLIKINPSLVSIKTSESIVLSKLKVYLDDPKVGAKIAELGVKIETVDKFKAVVK